MESSCASAGNLNPAMVNPEDIFNALPKTEGKVTYRTKNLFKYDAIEPMVSG